MTERQQIMAFADDLDKLVARYEQEFELSMASAVGALMFKAHAIMTNAMDGDSEEDQKWTHP